MVLLINGKDTVLNILDNEIPLKCRNDGQLLLNSLECVAESMVQAGDCTTARNGVSGSLSSNNLTDKYISVMSEAL